MVSRRDTRSFYASICFHAVVLASLYGARLSLVASAPAVSIELHDTGSASDETTLVESAVSPSAEISMSDGVGGTSRKGLDSGVSAVFSGAGIEKSARRALRPKVASQLGASTWMRPRLFNDGEHDDAQLAQDLGERAVKGEPVEPSANYKEALSRITQELTRLMREGPLLIVWLFDESESMRDDQASIRANILRVCDELGLEISGGRVHKDNVTAKVKGKRNPEPLQSAVVGFGEHVHPVLQTPTSDFRALRGAIDQLAVDESGVENTAAALGACLEEYRARAKRQKRRLVFVVVTDESGDDWEHLEELISRVRDNRSPVYILGREAIFGYPWAHMRWVDPIFGLTHWLQVSRGPETAFPECLQWDGLHGRTDAFSSGAAPYELARIASESGGIYFVLPGDEQNLIGAGANEKRRLAFLNLKQYQPDLGTRDEYEQSRNASHFRSTIWSVIRTLNPHLDAQLQIREWNYPADPVMFREVARGEFQKALRAMALLNQAVNVLDGVRPFRATESSQRWRANYDLLCAQCLAYRVRLFQFLLAIDQHTTTAPPLRTPTNNCWNAVRQREILPPNDSQVQQTNVDLKELNAQEKEARRLFHLVLTEHAGTPWARRAEYELKTGFGFTFAEGFSDPRYAEVGKSITLPKF